MTGELTTGHSTGTQDITLPKYISDNSYLRLAAAYTAWVANDAPTAVEHLIKLKQIHATYNEQQNSHPFPIHELMCDLLVRFMMQGDMREVLEALAAKVKGGDAEAAMDKWLSTYLEPLLPDGGLAKAPLAPLVTQQEL